MQYKPLEICHMENAILGKDFNNLGMLGPYFILSPLGFFGINNDIEFMFSIFGTFLKLLQL